MVILQNSSDGCYFAGNYYELSKIIDIASNMMCEFISMANGKEMRFPKNIILERVKKQYPDCIVNPRLVFVVKFRELNSYNTYDLSIKGIETSQSVLNIHIDNAKDFKSLGVFNSTSLN